MASAELQLTLMKNQFYKNLYVRRKLQTGKNTAYIDDKQYQLLLRDVDSVKTVGKKTPRDYWLSKRYDILTINQNRKLIYPKKDDKSTVRFYVSTGELFDILHETHTRISHGGRDRMMKELWIRFKNITRQDIETYIQVCKTCQQQRQKKLNNKKDTFEKHMLASELLSRSQLGLINCQSMPDGDFQFILVYRDYVSKFLVLKPLRTQNVEEIVENLLEIFTLLGAPAILESNHDREFTKQIIETVKKHWPTLTIVHGKSSDAQSEDSIELVSQDIKNTLRTWTVENDTGNWSRGLKFIQLTKNTTIHSNIKVTPHEALFGSKVKIGLSLPDDYVATINAEEDLEDILNNLKQKEAKKTLEIEISEIKTEQAETSEMDIYEYEEEEIIKGEEIKKEDEEVSKYSYLNIHQDVDVVQNSSHMMNDLENLTSSFIKREIQ